MEEGEIERFFDGVDINGIFIAQPSVTIKGGPGVNLSCNSSDLNGFAITSTILNIPLSPIPSTPLDPLLSSSTY